VKHAAAAARTDAANIGYIQDYDRRTGGPSRVAVVITAVKLHVQNILTANALNIRSSSEMRCQKRTVVTDLVIVRIVGRTCSTVGLYDSVIT